MEPGTWMAEPNTLELRWPSLWGKQIRDFLAQTAQESLEVLKSVSAGVHSWSLHMLNIVAAHIFGVLAGTKLSCTLRASCKESKADLRLR